MSDKDYGERIATLEAQYKDISPDITEIKADVKTLLAAHHQQKGMARLGLMVWTVVSGIVGGIAAQFMSGHH